jgi:hypothetical protein
MAPHIRRTKWATMALFCSVRQNCPHRFRRPSLHTTSTKSTMSTRGAADSDPDSDSDPDPDLDEI